MTARPSVAVLVLATVLVAACSSAAPGGGASSTSTSPSGAGASAAAGGGGGGGAMGGPVAAGNDLCGLLGPGDFAAAGVTGTGTATENNADPSDVYCVYAGKSAGTGGVEFDAFLATSKSDSGATFDEVAAPMLDVAGVAKAAFPDADGAKVRTDIPDGYAGIAIWKGKLVFDIGIPTTDKAQDQLIALAKLVLQRASGIV